MISASAEGVIRTTQAMPAAKQNLRSQKPEGTLRNSFIVLISVSAALSLILTAVNGKAKTICVM